MVFIATPILDSTESAGAEACGRVAAFFEGWAGLQACTPLT